MPVSVVRPNELGADDIERWRTLQRQTPSLANPFLCPEFAVAVGRRLPGARVAVLTDGPHITGFFPFERRPLSVGVPIGSGLNNWQGVIHAPGADWDARHLLRGCGLSAWRFDRLVPGQDPFASYATATTAAPVIDLSDGFDSYREKICIRSRKFCRHVASRTRKLAREKGPLRFVVDSRDGADLRALLTWKSDQCRSNGWLDVFDRPWVVDVVEELSCTRTGSFGGLVTALYAGEDPVAAQLGLRYGTHLSGWFNAYNVRYRRYSPGLVQVLQMAEHLPAAGVRTIDMGGGAQYKEDVKSGDVFAAAGTVTRGTVSAAADRVRVASADWARRQVRRHRRVYRVADRVLRHYGRIG